MNMARTGAASDSLSISFSTDQHMVVLALSDEGIDYQATITADDADRLCSGLRDAAAMARVGRGFSPAKGPTC